MKGLKRFFTLLAVSAAFALFTGNLTILADNPAGGTDGDSISGSVQTEPEAPAPHLALRQRLLRRMEMVILHPILL